MQNRDPHIELSAAQITRRNQPPPIPYNELPPDEEDDQDPQNPQQNPPLLPQNPLHRPQNSTLTARIKAWFTVLFGRDLDKAMKRALRLMLFCYVIDLILMCPLIYDDFYTELRSKIQIQGALDFMSANLKANPIMDLQIIGKKSACPTGFELLRLSHWPGTVAGFISNCSDLESGGCQKDIPKTNSMEIKEWDSSLWCGKRAVLGQDYVKKAECPMGYKECYNGGCFKGECPITKVKMDSKGGIVIAKTQGELPLIDIQATLNDIPCFNREFSAKANSSYGLRPVEKFANKGCDKYGFDDKYSTKLSSKSLFDSYTQDSYKDSTKNLPYFQKYSKETMSVLSWRVRMKTAKNDYCLDFDQNLAKNSIWAFQRSFMPASCFALVFICHLMIPFSLGICRCCQGKARFLISFKSNLEFASFICLLTALIIWAPGWLFYKTEYYPELRMAKKYFAEYDSLGCFGENQGGLVIQDFLWMLAKREMNYYVLSGLFLSNLLAFFACCWHFWMGIRIQIVSRRAYLLNLAGN